MDGITELLTKFSSWAVSITAILSMLALLFKPFRKVISKITAKMKTNHSIEDKIDELETKITTQIAEVSGKCDEVSQKCDENERDRLKQVIFSYGNFARKKQHISSEEYRYLQMVFVKYTKLGGNDIAHAEYDFVSDYYNHQEN